MRSKVYPNVGLVSLTRSNILTWILCIRVRASGTCKLGPSFSDNRFYLLLSFTLSFLHSSIFLFVWLTDVIELYWFLVWTFCGYNWERTWTYQYQKISKWSYNQPMWSYVHFIFYNWFPFVSRRLNYGGWKFRMCFTFLILINTWVLIRTMWQEINEVNQVGDWVSIFIQRS